MNILFNLLKLPRIVKQLSAIFFDIILCILTIWYSYYIRLGEFIYLYEIPKSIIYITITLSFSLFWIFGFYKTIFRYYGWLSVAFVSKIFFIYSIIFFSIFTLWGIDGVPRTLGIIQPILFFILILTSRQVIGIIFSGEYRLIFSGQKREKFLIYGAGRVGRDLALSLSSNQNSKVVGFVDDDKNLQGNLLLSLPVISPKNISYFKDKKNVKTILLAIPSISRKRRIEIIKELLSLKVKVRSVPKLDNILKGIEDIDQLKKIEITELLGRDKVEPLKKILVRNIKNKIVLITGAGGSIGSELARQIIIHRPKKLLLLDQSEFNLYSIHQELIRLKTNIRIVVPIIASINDKEIIDKILLKWTPDTIYHAAAYKHVPLVEYNFSQGIINNVYGTYNLAESANNNNVSNFVFISTDKAVRPTNIMGASKRLAEMTIQSFSEISHKTCFTIVRFGNVLGSSGSVIPKFEEQIRKGGPITLTHPNITRYFMTIQEAAELVIQAGGMSNGNEVFVLDMGEPIKIYELAVSMIELSGLQVKNKKNINGDIEIKITGLRPGEKLYEELQLGKNIKPSMHPRIMKSIESFIPQESLLKILFELRKLLDEDELIKTKKLLKKIVSGYKPHNKDIQYLRD